MPITKSTAETTVYNRAQEAVSSTLNEEVHEPEPPDSLSLVDQYVALLMATFIESGLLEVSHPSHNAAPKDLTIQALVALIGENVSSLNRKATLLLGEMLQKANRILPLQYAAQVQVRQRRRSQTSHITDSSGTTYLICRIYGLHKPDQALICSFSSVLDWQSDS